MEFVNTQERIDLVSHHYQRKFDETKKEEFNIFTLDIDKEIKPHTLESLLTDGTTEDDPKKIVMYDSSEGHATGLLVTHDKKIMMIALSSVDNLRFNELSKILNDNGLGKKYKMSKSFHVSYRFGLYQKDYISCVMLVFKHLKLLAANNSKLFKQIKPINDLEFMLPPEALRYAQSDEFLDKYIPYYQEKNNLDDMQTQLIADDIKKYRDDNFGQLRILYHQIKHFSGSEERKKQILKQLQNYQ